MYSFKLFIISKASLLSPASIKITSSLKKLSLNNHTLRYAIKKPTKGESTTITYYADKDGKLPLNKTIITCM